jgi:hypothetical protein
VQKIDRELEMTNRSDFRLNDIFPSDWIWLDQIWLPKQECILISSQSCKFCNLVYYDRFSKHWFDCHNKLFRKL